MDSVLLNHWTLMHVQAEPCSSLPSTFVISGYAWSYFASLVFCDFQFHRQSCNAVVRRVNGKARLFNMSSRFVLACQMVSHLPLNSEASTRWRLPVWGWNEPRKCANLPFHRHKEIAPAHKKGMWWNVMNMLDMWWVFHKEMHDDRWIGSNAICAFVVSCAAEGLRTGYSLWPSDEPSVAIGSAQQSQLSTPAIVRWWWNGS